jgi:hypothetical protein
MSTSTASSLSYQILDGSWPVLEQAVALPTAIMKEAYGACNSSFIGSSLGYFDLGMFYIHTTLLKAHPTQRSVSLPHIEALQQSFANTGIRRAENPGVVIGLGNGWHNMKNSHPVPVMITPGFSHLYQLQIDGEGPVGEIIRGNHRTIAMQCFSQQQEQEDLSEPFWLYRVLITGELLYTKLVYDECLFNIETSTNCHILFFLTTLALTIWILWYCQTHHTEHYYNMHILQSTFTA